jgi:hypothetical protein
MFDINLRQRLWRCVARLKTVALDVAAQCWNLLHCID